jgi:hypothetical protein
VLDYFTGSLLEKGYGKMKKKRKVKNTFRYFSPFYFFHWIKFSDDKLKGKWAFLV